MPLATTFAAFFISGIQITDAGHTYGQAAYHS